MTKIEIELDPEQEDVFNDLIFTFDLKESPEVRKNLLLLAIGKGFEKLTDIASDAIYVKAFCEELAPETTPEVCPQCFTSVKLNGSQKWACNCRVWNSAPVQ